jgi:hypothetical protein
MSESWAFQPSREFAVGRAKPHFRTCPSNRLPFGYASQLLWRRPATLRVRLSASSQLSLISGCDTELPPWISQVGNAQFASSGKQRKAPARYFFFAARHCASVSQTDSSTGGGSDRAKDDRFLKNCYADVCLSKMTITSSQVFMIF